MGQFALLLWKNWTLQKKRKVLTAFEIGLPTFFPLLLMALRQIVSPDVFDSPTYWEPFSVDELPNEILFHAKHEVSEGKWQLVYSPDNAVVRRLIDDIGNRLNLASSGYQIGFANEEKLLEFMAAENVSTTYNILSAIVFTNDFPDANDLPDDVAYKMRPVPEQRFGENRGTVDTASDWFTSYVFPEETTTEPREKDSSPDNGTTGGKPGYYMEGFLSLQHALDLAIVNEHTNNSVAMNTTVMLQRHPYPPYTKDFYVIIIQTQMPFIILLSFIVMAPNIVKDIVLEKELKLKEYMRMMGLRNWQHWLAWFIKYFIIVLIAVIMMIIFFFIDLGKGGVFNNSDASLIFAFLLLYCITTILFCFAISTFFSKGSSGSAAGAILFLASYTPYFFLANQYEDMNVGSKSMVSLLHNVGMAFGCYLIGQYEGRGVGMKWSNFSEPINVNDDFTMLHVFIMLLVDCALYSFIAWYVNGIKPGDYGSPLPFYFPCTKRYWCSDTGEDLQYAVDEEAGGIYRTNSTYFEPSPASIQAGIRIRNLTKVFKKDGKKRVAVNGMTLDMYENQITALLGHNGAGKTTTMFMLTGFLPPTSGTAYVNKYNVRRDLDKVRTSLGLCPQHNVLFDTMTVSEHLYFFGRLKGIDKKEIKGEVENMVRVLDLVEKSDAESKGLSGGQKRKLSVGIALLGGSKVVILDEPSSGMDPQARREMWDILQSQRSGRTMVLSTHFMDEADFLGDRIAIMAEGEVQCCGTSMFLKGKYGVGYHMVIVKEPSCDVDQLTDVIKHHVPDAEMESNVSAELAYVLPKDSSSRFEGLFSHLEGKKQELGIASFGASVTTMEEVFLKVGQSVDDDLEAKLKNTENKTLNGAENPAYQGSMSDLAGANGHENPKNVVGVRDPTTHFERNTGLHRLGQQFRALVQKRVIHSWRNKAVTVAQFLLPIAFTIVGCLVIKSFPGSKDPPSMELTLDKFDSPVVPYHDNGTDPLVTDMANAYKKVMTTFTSSIPNVDENSKLAEGDGQNILSRYLAQVGDDSFSKFINSYMVAASFVEDVTGVTFTGMFNNEAYHTPAVTLNNVGNTLLKHYAGDGKTIVAENHPLPRSTATQVNDDTSTGAVVGSILSYNLLFGMCFLVGSFVLFIVRERVSKAKHIQFVSGVHITTYWSSAFVWDLVNYMIPSLICVLVFAVFDIKPYYKGEQGGCMILLFLLYGFAILPHTYVMSYIFTVPASGYTWVTVINLMLATFCLIAVDVLKIPSLGTEDIGKSVEWACLALVPSYCFLSGTRNLYTNYENIKACDGLKNSFADAIGVSHDSLSIGQVCDYFETTNTTIACCPGNCDDFCVDYHDNYLHWDLPGLGRPLFFMFLQFIVWFLILFFIDSGFSKALREGMTSCFMGTGVQQSEDDESHHIPLADHDQGVDCDVKAEHDRIMHTPMEQLHATDSLLLAEVKKYYGNFLAVQELTLGVPQGECFGLLGVNGAGKTTTFKMLTGDETLSGGNAWLGGHSVKTSIKQAQQQMGYCPQFDALIDQMTVMETLMMYGRLRGIQEHYLPQVVANLITSLLLDDFADKRAGDLSGGNKRKLSTAMALIGDPPIIFLDEPTTGVDPVARRLLWDTLNKVRATGRTLILTSHSMEECEALCTRMAIMVNGQFKCLGSNQGLKSKFGDGYTLMAKIAPGHNEDVETMTRQLMTFVDGTFPGSVLKDKHRGFVHYHIGLGNMGWAQIFGTMERAKDQYNLEDYSVSQTTLEQVFLNFARAQRPPRDTKMTTGTKCKNCCNFLFCCGCCSSKRRSVSPEPQ